ncbi:ornithine cyclodeaminase family protein [Proteiniclasticum sp. QWL-01]|uniref:ornithine cyclodeaminase family protein n=1 Tax=Proteiniclasticum sp. QWL-01 TaxID=3036945 RepID=UPI0024119477|nr:ornithine cyclodeaminase family protein [Proteiniclasticum sp. QWL-01]WFF74361.1 ornithine cyclodeaminase family protein [Proteiniclasticum sp. QWL-01]
MKILLLNQEEMKRVITMAEAIRADQDALAMYSRGESDIPLRVNLNIEEFEGQSLYMPGYARAGHALGVKIVSVYPRNIEKGITSVPSTMVLQDDATGQVIALMDGTYLTQLRTGAVAGAATDLLARLDARNFVLIGTGGQAATQLEAILDVRPIRDVRVYDVSPERAKAFADAMARRYDVAIRASEDLSQDIREADIITTVTTAKVPVFDGTLLKKGVHINGVGSYTPEMSEIPPEVLLRAGKIFVDTKDAITESGDFQKLIRSGQFDPSRITGELGELVSGRKPGRESLDEITFFETTGNAILDIVVARKIYENAREMGIGTLIDL